MPILKSINNWFAQYRKFLLVKKNGFWEIPYLSNTPETIVKSIIKMPFTKHEPKRQFVVSKTPLIKGNFYYEEIEEGLWLINNELSYNANIIYIKVGDSVESSNWYLLNLTVFGMKQKQALLDGVPHTNCAWILYKPNTWSTNCHFKGAKELAFTFYFSKDWLINKMAENQALKNSPIRHFFDSERNYDIWNSSIDSYKPYYKKIVENFSRPEGRTTTNKEELKTYVYDMIEHFFSMYKLNNISESHFKISDKLRTKMYQVEKLLLERLMGPFPGLNFLAKELGISETSLKVNFKLTFATSVGQYFQMKQMQLAKEILLNDQIIIKDLAGIMGYENASKFAIVFKKHNNILPSKLKMV